MGGWPDTQHKDRAQPNGRRCRHGDRPSLLEQSATDPVSARILPPGLAEYLIPTHADAPRIDITFIDESDTEINPLGS
jgi:xanthine dehydrogenase YagR molybdenum-binding subunit